MKCIIKPNIDKNNTNIKENLTIKKNIFIDRWFFYVEK